jgi:hypothetical protein
MQLNRNLCRGKMGVRIIRDTLFSFFRRMLGEV